MKKKARILLFTGDGKGKTTAALGIVLRAVGHRMPTYVLQFIKHDASTGELAALSLLPYVTLRQMGRGFVPPATHPAFPAHRRAAEAALQKAQAVVKSRRYKVVILDEICNALAKKLITQKAVVAMLKGSPADKIIVLTGRGAQQSLIKLADTVTEMICLKHGFETGRPAEKGVEC
ncbi:MAG: cob(I)yrinic acid a,c-diamide adenosyltransferase [bacterium]